MDNSSSSHIGQSDRRYQLDDGHRIEVKKHNEEVDKNRHILTLTRFNKGHIDFYLLYIYIYIYTCDLYYTIFIFYYNIFMIYILYILYIYMIWYLYIILLNIII